MAKARLITHDVEDEIYKVWHKHPTWSAAEIRDEVIHLLKKKAKKNGQPSPPKDWLSTSSIYKRIQKWEKIPESPLDNPFSLGATIKHGIPAEVITLLFEIQKRKPDFTIRQARWAVKLHVVFEKHAGNIGDMPALLGTLAKVYALHERMWEVTEPGKPFNTSMLDQLYLMPVSAEKEEIIYRVAELSNEEFAFLKKDKEGKKVTKKRRTK